LSQAGDETRADFASKSTKSCYIGGFRKRDIDREAVASPGGSDAKRRTSELGYWSGTINLSRIGFSAAKDEALVYAESSCGSLCGSGDLFLLRKRGDRWEMIAQSTLWLS
jgi:hypothetical protein